MQRPEHLEEHREGRTTAAAAAAVVDTSAHSVGQKFLREKNRARSQQQQMNNPFREKKTRTKYPLKINRLPIFRFDTNDLPLQ